jgi:hypothetical protein
MRNRLLTFVFVSAICLLSALFSQTAPTTQAAALSSTQAAANPSVRVYATNVRVHDFNACPTPSTQCPVVAHINPGTYQASCQKEGEKVSDLGYTNTWWTELLTPDGKWGWVTNIYIKGGQKIAGVPDCTDNPAPAPSPSPPGPAPSGVACTASMTPLVRLYKDVDKSNICYNDATKPPETVSDVTLMCINGGVQVTFEAPAGSGTQMTIDGGSDFVNKAFNPATTIHIVEIAASNDQGQQVNNCHV